MELYVHAAAYTAGFISNELGLPMAISLALSMGSGIAVSKLGSKYVFKTADGLSVEWEPPKGTKPEAIQALDDAAAGKSLDEALEGGLNYRLKNIYDFIAGNKSFEDVLDDYSRIYGEMIRSNKSWSWDEDVLGADILTASQKAKIKQNAIDKGIIPNVKVTKVEGMKFGFADFEGAGVVADTKYLPKDLWLKSDIEQFKWLDDAIGGRPEGMIWHHTEIPGKMELVPFGIHNITAHNGGRTSGMWADAIR